MPVPQVLIRDVEPVVIQRLKERAKRNGNSMESELRGILRQASGVDMEMALLELRHIQEAFAGRTFTDSVELLREDRER